MSFSATPASKECTSSALLTNDACNEKILHIVMCAKSLPPFFQPASKQITGLSWRDFPLTFYIKVRVKTGSLHTKVAICISTNFLRFTVMWGARSSPFAYNKAEGSRCTKTLGKNWQTCQLFLLFLLCT